MERFQDSNAMTDVVKCTRQYLDSILAEERLIDSQEPLLNFSLFGESFASPIMLPAFSHLKTFASEREDGMSEYSLAAAQMKQVNWVGMCENDEFAVILGTGAKTIRIIKPYADKDKFFSQMEFAEKHGALAIGMDIDHIFGADGKYDVVFGEKMRRQTIKDLKEYVKFTNLPFIVKGILSVQDAVKCAEAGVKGIVVSHHHGRMPSAIPPVMVLPEIAAEVKKQGEMKLFVDCCIDSGTDAFKAIALGADAVSAGRILMPGLVKGGCEGVKEFLQKMNEQLAEMMAYTGCTTLEDINSSVLWSKDGRRMGV